MGPVRRAVKSSGLFFQDGMKSPVSGTCRRPGGIDKCAVCGILYKDALYPGLKRQTPGDRRAQSHASFAVYKERQTAEDKGCA